MMTRRRCCCDESECVGEICVTLSKACRDDDVTGVVITVKDHATGNVVASATTSGTVTATACFQNLTPGVYDVYAEKTDCLAGPWISQTVGCSTLNLAGRISCLPYGARKFTVYGCYGTPLPGAAITVTGPDGGTTFTNADGIAYFGYTQAGTYTATISHDRFTSVTQPPWTVANACDYSSADPVQLVPSAAYQCCEIQKLVDPPSPYPIPVTLRLSDGGGSITFSANNCVGTTICGLDRVMDNIIIGDVGTATCNGFTYQTPPPIGGGTTRVLYTVRLDTAPVASQAMPISQGVGGGNQWLYNADGCVVMYRAVRVHSETCDTAANDVVWASTGYTVNSLYPLNVSFSFDPGGDFGPSATPLTQYPPYTVSVVVSE